MMKLKLLLLLLITAGGFCESTSFQDKPSADDNIFFRESDCDDGGGKFAIIIHGWMASCSEDTPWAPDLLSNLTVHRGGCVICMDYSNYSKQDYFGRVVPLFSYISKVLLEKLKDLEKLGYDTDDGFLFGFSFGAHLAIEAGRRFGLRKLGRIDVCDPAGPGFDTPNLKFSLLDPKLAARNVQCIYTSQLSMKRRTCHQNWNMGNCGLGVQDADIAVSHTLCPKIYNSAFRNEFRPVKKPTVCVSRRPVSEWPDNFRMGYFSDVESGIAGDLYAKASKIYPYNVVD